MSLDYPKREDWLRIREKRRPTVDVLHISKIFRWDGDKLIWGRGKTYRKAK